MVGHALLTTEKVLPDVDIEGYDHVNIRIPADRVDECIEFYRDGLGLEPEDVAAYREGNRPIFGFWLTDDAIIHVRPIESLDEPDVGYGHAAVRVREPIDAVRNRVEDSRGQVVRELTPKGATGRAPAVYVKDPFGFRWEFKQTGGD